MSTSIALLLLTSSTQHFLEDIPQQLGTGQATEATNRAEAAAARTENTADRAERTAERLAAEAENA